MKFYGYKENKDEDLLILREVSIVASPEALRSLAKFLAMCADDIENSTPGDWEHAHFEDSEFGLGDGLPSFIVGNPDIEN